MTDAGDVELSLAAKAAVRTYMLKLLALPAVIAAILSFVVGFGINELARGAAYNAALDNYAGRFETYSQKVMDQAVLIASTHTTVNKLLLESSELKSKAVAALQDVDDKSRRIAAILSQNAARIAQTLATEPEFRTLLGNASSAELGALSQDVSSLKGSIQTAFASVNKVAGTVEVSSTEPLNNGGGTMAGCPEGAFVTRLQLYKAGDGVRTINVSCGILSPTSVGN